MMARLHHAHVTGDHGSAERAIEFAFELDGSEIADFLRAWRQGDADDWPEFYAWLDAQEKQGASA